MFSFLLMHGVMHMDHCQVFLKQYYMMDSGNLSHNSSILDSVSCENEISFLLESISKIKWFIEIVHSAC
jgi:hypothetical protein